MPENQSERLSNKLFIRLSSLGDVILASAALEAIPEGEKVDWIVGKEYASLLRNHPKIGKLWEFDRRLGIFNWIRFIHALTAQGYTHVFDLHLNLRSRIARSLFFIFSPRTKRKSISKERFLFLGLFVFKKFWPKKWQPTLQIEKFFRAATVPGSRVASAKTNLTHLLSHDVLARIKADLPARFYCVMPSANWIAKRWPPQSYFEVIRSLDAPVVVMGMASDQESVELVRLLEAQKIKHYSGIGKWNLVESAHVLALSLAYIGNDTGLAHLAESVGKKAFMIFGPSGYAMGFGPYLPESKAIESPLWCRPCGKDGRACFRVFHRYKCLDELAPGEVTRRILHE